MGTGSNKLDWNLGVLLRGEPDSLCARIQSGNLVQLGYSFLVIAAGGGLYGAAMGCWRASTQALFVAVKLPLILLLTSLGNAVLNGMLAPLLGCKTTFRQSFFAILLSCSVAATILGSFSPLVLFLVWNAEPMIAHLGGSGVAYHSMLLTHVAVIALAGTIANFRVLQVIREFSQSAAVASRVLFAWLVGNLFLGSQVCWILRPFMGSPDLPVQFLRQDAFKGNFYETVFHTLNHVLTLTR